MEIKRPRFETSHPDFALECEAAMEDAFRELADEAIRAGWPAGIVHDALVSLAENQRLAYQEDPDPAGE